MENAELNVKKGRKKNFSDSEIRVLLEEVASNAALLMTKNNAKINNQKKNMKWKEIAEKVTACGMAVRHGQEAKDKFKRMRVDVINRQREMRKTGGGNPPPPVPFEQVILQIIGEGSNLVEGIRGVDLPEPVTEAASLNEDGDETASSCQLSTTTEADGSVLCTWTLPEVLEADQPTQCSTILPISGTSTLPVHSSPIARVQPHKSRAEKTHQELGLLAKKRKLETRRTASGAHSVTGEDQEVWNQYLKSEIAKNESCVKANEAKVRMLEAKAVYYEVMTKKMKRTEEDV